MSNIPHRTLPPASNHIVHSFEYADAAARTAATSFISTDVGRVARQLSDNTFWVLASLNPVVWTALGGDAAAVFLGSPGVTTIRNQTEGDLTTAVGPTGSTFVLPGMDAIPAGARWALVEFGMDVQYGTDSTGEIVGVFAIEDLAGTVVARVIVYANTPNEHHEPRIQCWVPLNASREFQARVLWFGSFGATGAAGSADLMLVGYAL